MVNIIASLTAPRVAVDSKGSAVADYRPLTDASSVSSQSTDRDLLGLCRDHEWTERPIPAHRRPEARVRAVPAPDGWIRLKLLECNVMESRQPIFLQLALHDETSGAQLTQVVQFELNTPHHMQLLASSRGTAPHLHDTLAFFPLSLAQQPGVILVVRVDKVLDKSSSSDRAQYAAASAAKLGLYRQSWGYAIVPFGQVTSGPSELQVRSIMMRKSQVPLPQLIAASSPTSTGDGASPASPKASPCVIRFESAIVDNEQSLPLLSVHDRLARPTSTGATPVQGLAHHFAPALGSVQPLCSSTISHSLFIRPQQLVQKKGKGRNMTCCVEVCNQAMEPVASIVGRPHESAWKSKAYTNVAYHEKSPVMDDEIQCRLLPTSEPLVLRFTFYHVSCKDKQPGQLTLGGYAHLPLLNAANKFIDNGEYTLHVHVGDPRESGHPSPDGAHSSGSTESSKDSFTVAIHIESSLVVQDPHLDAFVAAPLEQADPLVVLNARLEELTKFNVLVLDRVFAKLGPVGPAGSARIVAHDAAMRALLHVYRVLTDDAVRRGVPVPSLVHRYVATMLTSADAHAGVTKAWCTILETSALAPASPSTAQWSELGLGVAASVFDSIIKSMSIAAKSSTCAEPIDVAAIRRLVSLISPLVHKKASSGLNMAKDLNVSLAYFIRDLVPLIPIDVILGLARLHSSPIDVKSNSTLIALKFDFLSILAGSEHAIPLDDIVTDVVAFMQHQSGDIRLLACSLMRDILAVRRASVPPPIMLHFADLALALLPTLTRPTSTSETLLLRTVAITALHCLEKLSSLPWTTGWLESKFEPLGWMQRLAIIVNDFQKFLEDYFKTGSTALMRNKRSSTGPILMNPMPVAETASQASKVDDRSIASEVELGNQVLLRALDVWDVLVKLFGESHTDAHLQFLLQVTWVPISDEGVMQVLGRVIKLIDKDPVLVLNTYTNELITAILRKASSAIPVVRTAAGQVLFAMFRSCHRLQQSAATPALRRAFATFRIHVTVAIAQFQDGGLENIAKCWDDIALRCEHCNDQAFRDTMRASSVLLSEVIRNQIKLETIPDLESRLDCYREIANRYHNTPDMRLCTLETMAGLYREQGNYVESGLVELHAAALIAEYLVSQTPRYVGPKGAKDFAACNPNVAEEALQPSVKSDGIFSSDAFSEDGLLVFLNKAVESFTKASFFEMVNEVNKLVIPVLEARRDWQGLSNVHQALATTFSTLVAKPNRMIATYYRVRFLGSAWEENNGVEFIYREKGVCVLPEFVCKLKASFASLGSRFEVLQDSGKIDESRLDATRAYVQVTHVEPYFGDAAVYPSGPPASVYDQHNRLASFLYMVPFTVGGRAHGDIASQYLRQVICHTERPFPYITKRLRVGRREETVLNPLQVSTQALNARCSRLKQLLHAVPVDAKSLQMVLSGSLRPQVNSGPAEIARVFLSPTPAPGQNSPVCAYSPADLEELRVAFRTFLRLSEVGVTMNRQLISHDQVGYQEDLENGFHELSEQLQPLLQATSARQKLALNSDIDAPTKSVVEFLGSQGDIASFLLS
ncbi:Dedicator of cytokinesis protein 9 [Blastocladiella emersonii ATCC 22665]|nr:Dedicator of cytokinesis protein 9 [Blastocladiella emersonii ATCC 22665]